jgi:glycosyltransferase involved in cell wall biosynthesis
MEKKKIVFLYTELAAYFMACVKELMLVPGVEVHIVRWPLNKEAPFDFSFPAGLKVYNRNEYKEDQALLDLVKTIDPALIYCSGWIDKGYMKVAKSCRKRIPVVVGFDNQWRGGLKQRIAIVLSRFFLLDRFTHCWVPGEKQVEYARRLGFRENNILTGFYCCDHQLFHDQYLLNREEKSKHFPRRFIYTGRYVEHKGIGDLWKAFMDLEAEKPSGWELWCIGTGDVAPAGHPAIRHFGFVQPEKLPEYLRQTGVFILPSHFEPWGVVVHEYAAAGFPLVVTRECGAASAFVEEGRNGYIYTAGDVAALKMIMKKIMQLKDDELAAMGDRSAERSKRITPFLWAEKLMQLTK